MARVVPVPLLSLFTGPELETMVCGSPDIPLDLLKSVVTYKGVDASAPLVRWFWDTLESFSNAERSLFLRFVWGRTRLPRTIVDFRGRDFVFQVSDHGSIHRPKASHVGDMFIIPYSRVAMVPKTPNFIHFLYFRPTFVMLTVESVRVPIVLLWGFG